MSGKIDGFALGARPLCAFCNAPWTDAMVKVLATSEVETYFDAVESVETKATVDIKCEACKRPIFRKEMHGNTYLMPRELVPVEKP